MSLESTFNPFVRNPVFRELKDLSVNDRVARLRDDKIRKSVIEGGIMMNPKRLFRFDDPPVYEPAESDSIEALAEVAEVSAVEAVLDILLENEGTGMIFLPALNYSYGNSDHCLEMLKHPYTVPGLGDGGAHVSFISDASFSTYLLTHWARDRNRGEKLPVEFIIKRQCRDTAELVGFLDRGLLEPGLKADLNIIDFEGLNLRRPEMQYDLPAGGKRLVQRAEGYRYTIVSGEIVLENGEPTGATPGRLVRGAQPAPG